MNLHKHIALAFLLLMGLLLSESAMHELLHESHQEDHHQEVCDGHHHEADENADTICSHEHQCELCVLIQSNTHFLPKVESQGISLEIFKSPFHAYENAVLAKIREVSSPRAPPIA